MTTANPNRINIQEGSLVHQTSNDNLEIKEDNDDYEDDYDQMEDAAHISGEILIKSEREQNFE